MRYAKWYGWLFFFLGIPLFAALGQEAPVSSMETEDFISPVIQAPDVVKVGEEVIFDATSSKIMSISEFGTPSFSWDFGDGSKIQFGKRIRHVYEKPGIYTVRLNVKQGQRKESIEKSILIYKKEIVLITDETGEALEKIEEEAGRFGIWLHKIMVRSAASDFSIEKTYHRAFQENLEYLRRSEAIVFYTQSVQGIRAFGQFWKKLSDAKKFSLKEKLIVQITLGSLEQMGRLVQPVFEILKPSFILLTRPEALSVLFQTDNGMFFPKELESRGIAFQKIDEHSRISIFLPLSRLMAFFTTQGISQPLIYVLLSVPFLAFIIAFFRQFVGIATFGVYAPLMLSMAFLVLGLEFGLVVFLVVMLISSGLRLIFERVDLLYIPRVSLLFSSLALSFFFILAVAVYFQVSIDLELAIFPMMVMSTLSEKFLASQSSQGLRSALVFIAETVFVSLAAYSFVMWDFVKDFVLALPELILLPILGIIWLGRFTGLRLSEYFKFRALFTDETME